MPYKDTQLLSKTEIDEAKSYEQLKRLSRLIPSIEFDVLLEMSYQSRITLERVHELEERRFNQWYSALPSQYQIEPDFLTELIQILKSKTPKPNDLLNLCTVNNLENYIGLFLEIFSQGKKEGVIDLMSERGKTKRKKSSLKFIEIGVRWLQLENENPTKYGIKCKAAMQIADEFKMSYEYIKRLMKGNRDSNTTLFPDGINKARELAGLAS